MEEVKCAIYTRKSTDEGLEKEFNTLEAQREAGENYIKSQKHQGWVLVEEHYDDVQLYVCRPFGGGGDDRLPDPADGDPRLRFIGGHDHPGGLRLHLFRKGQ